MSVIESRILKKPMIAMRYEGIEEAIEDGKSGLIAEQTIDSLCKNLELLITDSNYREKMQEFLMNTTYSNEKAYVQFLEVLHNCK